MEYIPYIIDFTQLGRPDAHHAMRAFFDNLNNQGCNSFVYFGADRSETPADPSKPTTCDNCDKPIWITWLAMETLTGRKWAMLAIVCGDCGKKAARWYTRGSKLAGAKDAEAQATIYGAAGEVLTHLTGTARYWGSK